MEHQKLHRSTSASPSLIPHRHPPQPQVHAPASLTRQYDTVVRAPPLSASHPVSMATGVANGAATGNGKNISAPVTPAAGKKRGRPARKQEQQQQQQPQESMAPPSAPASAKKGPSASTSSNITATTPAVPVASKRRKASETDSRSKSRARARSRAHSDSDDSEDSSSDEEESRRSRKRRSRSKSRRSRSKSRSRAQSTKRGRSRSRARSRARSVSRRRHADEESDSDSDDSEDSSESDSSLGSNSSIYDRRERKRVRRDAFVVLVPPNGQPFLRALDTLPSLGKVRETISQRARLARGTQLSLSYLQDDLQLELEDEDDFASLCTLIKQEDLRVQIFSQISMVPTPNISASPRYNQHSLNHAQQPQESVMVAQPQANQYSASPSFQGMSSPVMSAASPLPPPQSDVASSYPATSPVHHTATIAQSNQVTSPLALPAATSLHAPAPSPVPTSSTSAPATSVSGATQSSAVSPTASSATVVQPEPKKRGGRKKVDPKVTATPQVESQEPRQAEQNNYTWLAQLPSLRQDPAEASRDSSIDVPLATLANTGGAADAADAKVPNAPHGNDESAVPIQPSEEPTASKGNRRRRSKEEIEAEKKDKAAANTAALQSRAPAAVVEPVAVAKQKRTRRTKEQIQADEAAALKLKEEKKRAKATAKEKKSDAASLEKQSGETEAEQRAEAPTKQNKKQQAAKATADGSKVEKVMESENRKKKEADAQLKRTEDDASQDKKTEEDKAKGKESAEEKESGSAVEEVEMEKTEPAISARGRMKANTLNVQQAKKEEAARKKAEEKAKREETKRKQNEHEEHRRSQIQNIMAEVKESAIGEPQEVPVTVTHPAMKLPAASTPVQATSPPVEKSSAAAPEALRKSPSKSPSKRRETCGVCQSPHVHAFYQCPIVTRGKDSVRHRLDEIDSKREKTVTDVAAQEALQRWLATNLDVEDEAETTDPSSMTLHQDDGHSEKRGGGTMRVATEEELKRIDKSVREARAKVAQHHERRQERIQGKIAMSAEDNKKENTKMKRAETHLRKVERKMDEMIRSSQQQTEGPSSLQGSDGTNPTFSSDNPFQGNHAPRSSAPLSSSPARQFSQPSQTSPPERMPESILPRESPPMASDDELNTSPMLEAAHPNGTSAATRMDTTDADVAPLESGESDERNAARKRENHPLFLQTQSTEGGESQPQVGTQPVSSPAKMKGQLLEQPQEPPSSSGSDSDTSSDSDDDAGPDESSDDSDEVEEPDSVPSAAQQPPKSPEQAPTKLADQVNGTGKDSSEESVQDSSADDEGEDEEEEEEEEEEEDEIESTPPANQKGFFDRIRSTFMGSNSSAATESTPLRGAGSGPESPVNGVSSQPQQARRKATSRLSNLNADMIRASVSSTQNSPISHSAPPLSTNGANGGVQNGSNRRAKAASDGGSASEDSSSSDDDDDSEASSSSEEEGGGTMKRRVGMSASQPLPANKRAGATSKPAVKRARRSGLAQLMSQ